MAHGWAQTKALAKVDSEFWCWVYLMSCGSPGYNVAGKPLVLGVGVAGDGSWPPEWLSHFSAHSACCLAFQALFNRDSVCPFLFPSL